MLRFTIRDMLWLTVVAALACGWYITVSRETVRHRREEDEARLYWAKAQADADRGQSRLEAVAARWELMELNLRNIDARLGKLESSSQPRPESFADRPN
jgi:hypothetical protein